MFLFQTTTATTGTNAKWCNKCKWPSSESALSAGAINWTCCAAKWAFLLASMGNAISSPPLSSPSCCVVAICSD